MPSGTEGQNQGRTRVVNACQRCRKHKIKCSGTEPCRACNSRGTRCEFDSRDKRIAISESTLRSMQEKLSELERQRNEDPSQLRPNGSFEEDTITTTQSFSSQYGQLHSIVGQVESRAAQSAYNQEVNHESAIMSHEDNAVAMPVALTNPLVNEHPTLVSDSSGKLRFLGHSSTWSFSQQLLHLSHHSPLITPTAQLNVNTEASVYNVKATQLELDAEEFTRLPSMELSLFYFHSVKFRTYPLFYLFDEEDFTSKLVSFYEGRDVHNLRLWYIHYLLIMAFGKAFTARSTCCSAGSDLFDRALRLLPDVTVLCQEPIHSTEILCCLALYLQSIDHRTAAHLYIGQALRMSQTHGLYTNLQESTLGTHLVTHCRRLWWTVFTLDRRLGSSFGVPNGFNDQDVTAPFPSASDPSDISAKGQTLNVKICQLLGKIVSTVYSNVYTLNQTFVTTTQEVLRGIAPLAEEISEFSACRVGEVSRVAANISLAYHQCIMLASRPFLFHLLKARLDSSDPSQTLHLSSSMKGLVQVGIDSATQAAMTLSRLKEHELIDSFIPFDLETTFSAALILVTASGVHPRLLPGENWLAVCCSVFDHMGTRGNTLAALRKSEIKQLEDMRSSLSTTRRQGTDLGGRISDSTIVTAQQSSPVASFSDRASIPSLGDPFFDQWLAEDGFSGAQILDLADALNTYDVIT